MGARIWGDPYLRRARWRGVDARSTVLPPRSTGAGGFRLRAGSSTRRPRPPAAPSPAPVARREGGAVGGQGGADGRRWSLSSATLRPDDVTCWARADGFASSASRAARGGLRRGGRVASTVGSTRWSVPRVYDPEPPLDARPSDEGPDVSVRVRHSDGRALQTLTRSW